MNQEQTINDCKVFDFIFPHAVICDYASSSLPSSYSIVFYMLVESLSSFLAESGSLSA
jgi:hypothetical protein